ncbi:MAG: hypothetical protein QM723_03910 [Myxococcaceae bacterium]
MTLEVTYASAWKGLGFARERLGDAAAAKEAFESCLEADGGDLECQQGILRVR